MSENSIALIFVFPLFGAVLCALVGRKSRNLCHPIAVASLAGALWGGIETLRRVIASEANEVSYLLRRLERRCLSAWRGHRVSS